MFSLLMKNLCKFLSRNTSFCIFRFRTPSPPLDLGLVTSGHVALGSFLALRSAPLHRQYFLNLSTCLMTWPWSEKVHMKKVGKAVKTEFVSSNRPASERNWAVLTSLFSHRETKGQNSSTLGLVRLEVTPSTWKGEILVLASSCNLSSEMRKC